MTHRARTAIGILLLGAMASGAIAQERGDDDLVAAYAALSPARQIEVLQAMQQAVAAIDEPYLHELAALADSARAAVGDVSGLHFKAAQQHGDDVGADWPLPMRYHYLWGWRAVMATAELGHEPKESAPRSKPRKPTEDPAAAKLRVAQVRALLQGLPPDADLVVAGILQRLDQDHHADDLARFLEAWRNGEESFYEALDRTAGTKEAVFFFDAMLADFKNKVVHGAEQIAAMRSLQEAHDALHRAFLAYRQYRALREALALTLVLPPDTALPQRLARYGNDGGGYGPRELAWALVGVEDRSPTRFLDALVAKAPPLPDPLWGEAYQPWRTPQELFQEHMGEMIEQEHHTDAYIANEKAWRSELAKRIGETARKELSAQMEAGKE